MSCKRFLGFFSRHRFRRRCKRFGTFMISSLGNFGTQTVVPIMPLTGYLTFGPIAIDGRVTVGLTFDHRVMDGRHAARALQDMETLLNTDILAEIEKLGANGTGE